MSVDEQTVTTGEYEGDYPPDDCDTTWHVHDDKTWAWGINCELCSSGQRIRNQAPMLAISTLQRQNIEGRTSREEEREMIGDRWNDEKIGRAR